MDHELYMREALKEAQISLDNKQLPVGAVVVMKGEIIGRGHRDYLKNFHLDHAETVALRNALEGQTYKRKETDITIYTTLEPCIMCIGTILGSPITRLVYAARDPYGGGLSILQNELMPVRHKGKIPEVIGGILEKDSKILLKKFLEVKEEDHWANEENPLIKYIRE
jgi:tRNA(adenine34) deaminase